MDAGGALRSFNILEASRDGELAVLENLLSSEVNINERSSSGCTALHWAARYNRRACIRALVRSGADVNAIDEQGFTPLHWATFLGSVDAILELLSCGANPTHVAKSGHRAVSLTHDPHVRAVISRFTQPDTAASSSMVRTVTMQEANVIVENQYLVARAADSDLRTCCKKRQRKLATPSSPVCTPMSTPRKRTKLRDSDARS